MFIFLLTKSLIRNQNTQISKLKIKHIFVWGYWRIRNWHEENSIYYTYVQIVHMLLKFHLIWALEHTTKLSIVYNPFSIFFIFFISETNFICQSIDKYKRVSNLSKKYKGW